MDQFEYQLRILVKYVQEHINSSAFAIYQPGFITIGYFDKNSQLNVLADVKMGDNNQYVFAKLYEQIRNKIRENEHIDITVEF